MTNTAPAIHATETPVGVEAVPADNANYRIWNTVYTAPAPAPRFVTVVTNNFQTGRPREIGFDGSRFWEAQAAWKTAGPAKMNMSLKFVEQWHEMPEVPDTVKTECKDWHAMDDNFSQWLCRKLFEEQFPA